LEGWGTGLEEHGSSFLEALQEMYLGRSIPKIPYPSVEAIERAPDKVAERDPRAVAI